MMTQYVAQYYFSGDQIASDGGFIGGRYMIYQSGG